MPKSVLTTEQLAHIDRVYAAGDFVKRRKGQRHAADFMGSNFYGQDGSLGPMPTENPVLIASTELIGTFVAYDHHGGLADYRAYKITLQDGRVFAGYSYDKNDYVLCQMSGYLHVKG